jgi:hypothetical protein
MTPKEAIEQSAERIGGNEWAILGEAAFDTVFHTILTDQERNLIVDLSKNPNYVSSYKEYFASILAKYISWKVYKETNLKIVGKKVDTFVTTINEKQDTISKRIEESEADLDYLNGIVKLASGASALVAYSETFSTTANKHSQSAKEMSNMYLIFLAILLLVIGLLLFVNIADYKFLKTYLAQDMLYNFSLAIFIIKIIIIFFFFQIVQFYKKSYNAEKHLEETYRHRSDVLQSLHAVYNSIDSKDEKDRLLSAAALFAYERGETGYITTKEGAGSSDITDSLFARIIK